MRKLSKKISMLMVLAMLVSLFSGIVSASAASAWSFKSSKYDVAVDETIEMEKNEYADFDLFKNDAAPEGYTVKWSSSNADAVWVNAKTGQLRADKFGKADLGDKATISATFTNTATKKSATRSFVIVVAEKAEYEITVNFGDEVLAVGQKYDLAAVVKADGKEVKADVAFAIDGKAIDAAYTPAAEGEFTIVTTATIDGKVVAEAKTAIVVVEAGLESAKQITFDTVALTFGSADVAKAVAADITKIGSVYMLGDNEIQNFVESAKVDDKNASVVNVTLFNNLIKDVTYKFTYGDKSASVKGADLATYNVRSISFAATTLSAWNNHELALNLYNADGVLIKVIKNSDLQEQFTTQALNDGAYNLDPYANRIYFHEAGATAIVKATYVMGYDNDGNFIPDLTCTANIVSINAGATKDSLILGWTVTGENSATATSNYSDNNTIGLEIDESKKLGFWFKATNIYTNQPTEYKYAGTEKLGGYFITFRSTNENVVLVDSDVNRGAFHAVGAGNAQILVYRAPEWDADAKELLGVYNVNVVNNRILTKIAPVATKRLLSTAGDDSVMIKLGAKDQLGENYANVVYVSQYSGISNARVSLEDGTPIGATTSYPTNAPGIPVALGCADYSDWELFFNVKATSAPANWGATVQLLITVVDTENNVTKSSVVTLTAKQPGAATRYAFEGVKNAIDTNLTANKHLGTGRFETALKLTAYDKDGYLVDVFDADFYAGEDAARDVYDGSEDVYFYEFTHNSAPVTADGNVFSAVAVSGNEIIKADKGSYVLVAKRVREDNALVQYVGTTSIIVSDSSPAITVVKKDNKLNGVEDIDDVLGALNFGSATDAKIAFDRNVEPELLTLVDVVSKVHVNPVTSAIDRVNVQSVWAREYFGDFNGDTVDDYFDTKVNVYFSYEVHNY